jgi:nitrite reductase (NADH) large subunit
VEDDRVVGATAVGDWPELGAVQEAIDDERHLTTTWLNRFTRGEDLWRPSKSAASARPDEEIVCACANVTAGTIRLAIAGGCKTADEVSCATGSARGCGSCLPLVSLMVGQAASGRERRARAWLAGFATAAIAGLAVALIVSPVALIALLDRHRLDFLFRDPFWQQVSGFTVLGTCVLAMLLPLAKRVLRVSGSALPVWRAAHAGIGLGALGALVLHTSLRRGHNLNLVLQASFAALLLLGAAAGLLGLTRGGALGRALRLAHLVVFWPLLSLIGLHVLAVYYF